MKIAVNIHCLHPPLTGIGHYARHLLTELLADESVESVAGISHQGWHSRELVESMASCSRGVPESSPAATAPGLARRVLRRVPGLGRLRAQVHHRLQRNQQRRYADHVYWEPNYLLLPVQNPALVTVHDLSHLRYPECHPAQRLRELARLDDSVERAAGLAVVSEFTRREVCEVYGLEAGAVAVVSPAVDATFYPRPKQELSLARKQLELPEQFILYTGTIEPRKNIPRLLQAYGALPAALRSRVPLVLAGGDGWQMAEAEAAMAKLPAEQVRRLGYVPFEQLPLLYSAATIFAYPSLYEGFGMPVLEAMASGTPVLTSDTSAMPEVAAGAATLVNPASVDAIRDALQHLLEDEAARDAQVARGLQVAAQHSWPQSYARLRSALGALAT